MKPDDSSCIYGDFKTALNPMLCADQYPLPLIEDLFVGLSGVQKFSKIYLSQAYLQVSGATESQPLLTIVTHKGLFHYTKLPFGITSTLDQIQRLLDQILSGLSCVQCYLDDF